MAYTTLASLIEAGLDVHSTDTGLIDLDDETSAMNFGIRALFSHNDHLKISKRMYEGKLAKARSGQLPAPIRAYGYRNNEPYEPEAQWVRWMFKEIHNQGMYALARELNRLNVPVKSSGKMWYNSTVCAILNNPAYKGMWRFGRKKETIHVPCTPIVSEDDWERAQIAKAARHKNHSRAGSRLDIFPLQGRIFCAVCGSAMSGQTWKAKPDLRYYFCRATQRLSALTAKCDHKISYPADKINDEVRNWLYKTFATEETLRASLIQPEEPEVDFTAIREEKQAEYNRWMKAYGSGKLDLDKVAEQLERLEKELAALPKTTPRQRRQPDFAAWRASVLKALESHPLDMVVKEARAKVKVFPPGDLEVEILL